ncbi:acyltransferase family protein [Streptococcus sciuri]|uniref:Acyltransferase n=1 Tax=Streptococcus sciuri TaxID=2973939 RepID=A0ABT2F930_9STRE|nr:acyltransferase family protein [Streptococcus sciuri]MCS4488934.1 acyltransferase [Streptococcus sciuri]
MRIKWFSLVRITGLLLVLLYHFFKNIYPGGFIGVDVFFTFSGYLITALLIDEYARNKKINLIGFYKRRFYRIVPPLVLMILVSVPFVFLVRSDFRAGISQQILAAIGFTTNLYEILTGSSYESQFIPHLFVHTWSLAIEVHFYLLWGFCVWCLAQKSRNQQGLRVQIFLISLGIFLVSYLSMFIRSFFVGNLSSIYFSTLSHIYPFFFGAILATFSGVRETMGRFRRTVNKWSLRRALITLLLGFLGLLLLTFWLNFESRLTYLFGFLLASIFASVMIYAARVLHEKTPTIVEPAIVTYIADISYSLYLFHWPFYIIFSQMVANWAAVLLTLLFSIIFATLSFYIIEPYIAGKAVKILSVELDLSSYRRWFMGGVTVLGLITLITMTTAPSVGRFESGLQSNALTQAQSSLNRTHTLLAGDANALSDIAIIGDSVALRSSAAFSEEMPEAQLDAAVSRNFEGAYDIFDNSIKNNSLSKIVVLAVGVNSLDNYQAELQRFINALPKGHRLVFVTPYNGKNITEVKEVRDYEVQLTKKYSYLAVADWYQTAVDNPDIWVGTDGVHYSDATTTGATLYVQTIKKAVQEVAKGTAKS